MTHNALNLIPLPDLARLALRDHPSAAMYLMTRLHEDTVDRSMSPFDLRASSAAYDRILVPVDIEARNNVVAI